MRKIATMLVVFTFIALPYACAAEEPIAPAAQEEIEPITLTGEVSFVVLADAEEGITENVINVVDDMGNAVEVIVSSATKIYDTSMLPVSLNEIKKGDKVSVEGTKTDDGSLEAISIEVIK